MPNPPYSSQDHPFLDAPVSPISMERIRRKLKLHRASRLEDSAQLKHAAVAVILRETPCAGPELLIIGRAEHPEDPWSGHLGFPGGRVEPSDASPERAAARETEEELGILLDQCARRIGALSELRARIRMEFIPMSIFPFVYELVKPTEFRRNEEVASACWVPLSYFADPANRAAMPHPVDPEGHLPCYPVGDRRFWGLSLAMLDELLRILFAQQ